MANDYLVTNREQLLEEERRVMIEHLDLLNRLVRIEDTLQRLVIAQVDLADALAALLTVEEEGVE